MMSRATDTDTPPNGIVRQPRYCVQIRPQFYCYRDRVGAGREGGGGTAALSWLRVRAASSGTKCEVLPSRVAQLLLFERSVMAGPRLTCSAEIFIDCAKTVIRSTCVRSLTQEARPSAGSKSNLRDRARARRLIAHTRDKSD